MYSADEGVVMQPKDEHFALLGLRRSKGPPQCGLSAGRNRRALGLHTTQGWDYAWNLWF